MTAVPQWPERVSLAGKRVWVAGHRGMVGSALCRRLRTEGCELLFEDRARLDLRRQADTEEWVATRRPEAIIVAAATVGGILANSTRPAEFLYDNLLVAGNIIEAARKAEVGKLLYLGSSCIYPREAPQPIPEEALLTGPLEPTNEWYAIAKIAGLKLCQAYRKQHGCDFIAAMPTNLYGPGDNFDLQSGHVVPALIRRIHEAKAAGTETVAIWGTGNPRREFLYVEDCADALVHLLKVYSDCEPVNVGTGSDITIRELAETIGRVVGYEGEFRFDPSKPDGTPRKLLDVGRIHSLGWCATTDLETGLRNAYADFQSRIAVSTR
ncbi:MAG: GDP-L-fucose synthase family protein [Planctomycetaceae bacterium]